MAHAIAFVGAQGITDAETASGVVAKTAQIAATNYQTGGVWVHVDLGTSAWTTYPGGYLGDPPAVVVSLFPRFATGGADMDDGTPHHQYVYELDKNGTYTAVIQFSVFFEGNIPEFFVLGVQNRTDTAIATNKLDMHYEFVGESTA